MAKVFPILKKKLFLTDFTSRINPGIKKATSAWAFLWEKNWQSSTKETLF